MMATSNNGYDRQRIVDLARPLISLIGAVAFAAWAFVVDNAATIVEKELRSQREILTAHVSLSGHAVQTERTIAVSERLSRHVAQSDRWHERVEERLNELERKVK